MVCACRRVGGFQCRKLACFLCGLDFLSVGFVLEDVLFRVDTMGEVLGGSISYRGMDFAVLGYNMCGVLGFGDFWLDGVTTEPQQLK